MAILWEDTLINKDSYYHNLLRDLSATLENTVIKMHLLKEEERWL